MKFKHFATIAVAALVMAAAPPQYEAPRARSPWSRFVEGARSFAHNPFGLVHREPRRRMPVPDVAEPQHHPRKDASAETMHLSVPQPQPGARQMSAFLPESIAADRAARQTSPTKRAAWFSRDKRKRRTVSEFMAQEKP
jgi:hypothetical protein